MNAPTYINSAHKALARNPGGLTLEELSGKLRAKALKVSQLLLCANAHTNPFTLARFDL